MEHLQAAELAWLWHRQWPWPISCWEGWWCSGASALLSAVASCRSPPCRQPRCTTGEGKKRKKRQSWCKRLHRIKSAEAVRHYLLEAQSSSDGTWLEAYFCTGNVCLIVIWSKWFLCVCCVCVVVFCVCGVCVWCVWCVCVCVWCVCGVWCVCVCGVCGVWCVCVCVCVWCVCVCGCVCVCLCACACVCVHCVCVCVQARMHVHVCVNAYCCVFCLFVFEWIFMLRVLWNC